MRAIALVVVLTAIFATGGAMAQSCPDNDGDGYVDCAGCLPDVGTICGDCDDGNPDANPEAPEYCNGLDDDCDGAIDNGFPVGAPCDGPDLDQCAEGTYSCRPDGFSVTCDDATATSQESCNGIDDDCDGLIDTYANSCVIGFGLCKRTGPSSCDPGDVVPACHILPGVGSQEICDGIDNNCDGRVDEDLVQSCSSGCGSGLTKCVQGQWSECTARPCCQCVVGPTGAYPALCDAINAGCGVVCVQPGVYSLLSDCYPHGVSLVSTEGRDATTILGDVVEAGRVQGFTIEGTVWFSRCGHFIGNHLVGGLPSYDDCNSLQVIAFNEIEGGLAVGAPSLIWGNVLHSGVATGFRKSQAISENMVSDMAVCIDAVGDQVDENTVVNCQTGIRLGRTGTVARNVIIGGAVAIDAGGEGAPDTRIVSNTILGPTETGIVYGSAGDVVRVTGNLIDGSQTLDPVSGAGIRLTNVQGSFMAIESNTIVGGSRGIDVQPIGAVVPVVNISSNIVVGTGSSAFDIQDAGPLICDHNDVYGQADPWAGVPAKAGVMGNISEDPRFVDPAGHDLRLRSDSPCVDAGLWNGMQSDLAGLPRLRDGDLDGSPVADIGAFEVLDEVLGLEMAADGTTVTWDEYAHATAGYDVYFGWLSEIHSVHALATHQAACHLMSTELGITSLQIPPGDGLVYLVAPHGEVAGSLGWDSGGQERPVTQSCP